MKHAEGFLAQDLARVPVWSFSQLWSFSLTFSSDPPARLWKSIFLYNYKEPLILSIIAIDTKSDTKEGKSE
jgi:hypothetical protein